MRRLVALGLVLVGLVALLDLVSSADAQPAPDDCPPFLVLGTRGSGDPVDSHGGMGAPGLRFAETFRSLLGRSNVGFWSNPYPAVPIFGNWEAIVNGLGAGTKLPLGEYHESVIDGTQKLREKIADTVERCAHTQLLLVGYSAGAQVAGDVYQLGLEGEERDRILGVALFGDPYFSSRDSISARGDFSVGRNGLLGERPAYSGSRVLSYCHGHDPICQGIFTEFVIFGDRRITLDPLSIVPSRHKNYHELGEPEEAARYFARLAEPEQTAPRDPGVPDCVTPLKTGVVFVIDDSGSMYQENDRNGLRFDAAAQGLQVLPAGSEAAVVKFSTSAETVYAGAVDDGIPSRAALALSGTATGGSTHYDQGLSVAEQLLQSQDFSAPDRLAVVFISDGLPNGGDYTAIRQRIAARRIPIFTVGIGAASQGQGRGVLEELSAENGGETFFIDDASANFQLITVFARIVSRVNCDEVLAVDTTSMPPATEQGYGRSSYPIDVTRDHAQLIGVVTWNVEGQVRVSLRRPNGGVLRLGSERPGEIVERGRIDERIEVSDPALAAGRWILEVENLSRTDPVRVSLAVFARQLGEPLPGAAELLAPVDNARVASSTARFSWSPAARAVAYDVVVDGRVLGRADGRTELEVRELEAGTHEWHVRAYNSSGRFMDSGSEVFAVSALDGRPSSTAPVIFMPGIMGSKLFCDTRTQVWPGTRLDDFVLADDGESAGNPPSSCSASMRAAEPELHLTGAGIVERVALQEPYADAVAWLHVHSALQAAGSQVAGDARGAFVFPYDWRKSPGSQSTQDSLDRFVDDVRTLSGSDNVRIVAHSMGGLVARWYVSEPARAAKVKKVVTLGTPVWGAPGAYAPLALGQTEPAAPFLSKDLILRSSEVRAFAKTSSGVYSLYPNDDYWDAVSGGGIFELNELPSDLPDLETAYTMGPVRKPVTGPAATEQLLSGWGARTSLMRQARADSRANVSSASTNGVNVQAVVGAGVRVVAGYRLTTLPARTPYGPVEPRAVEYIWATGDGTVPARSAAEGVWWRATRSGGVRRHYVCGTRHGDLVAFGESRSASGDRDGGRIAAAIYPFVFGNADTVLTLERPDSRECRQVEPDASMYFELPGFPANP